MIIGQSPIQLTPPRWELGGNDLTNLLDMSLEPLVERRCENQCTLCIEFIIYLQCDRFQLQVLEPPRVDKWSTWEGGQLLSAGFLGEGRCLSFVDVRTYEIDC